MSGERNEGGFWPLAEPDRALWITALLVLGFGLVMVASASMPLAQRLVGDAFHLFARQAAFAGVGLVLGYLVCRYLPLRMWAALGPALLVVVALLLVALLVPGVGREVNGSARWLPIYVFNVQVSEATKLCALIYLAGYIKRQADHVRSSFWGSLRPLLPLVVLAGLILAEPDLGAAGVLLATAFAVVFLAGMRLLPLLMSMAVAVFGLLAALYLSPYRRARLSSFLDPWSDPYAGGFQLTQSLIAVGRGEILGVGLGESVQKLFYLPEAHTDFVLAVIAEELGLLGVIALLVAYAVIVARCFRVGNRAARAEQPFGASLAYGVGVWFALQALINMGVSLGMLPTKGLTLPLVSYGGSSLVVMCLALALVLRVDTELGGVRRRSSAGAVRGSAGTGRRLAQLPFAVSERL